jgi:hypothetical protein
MGNPFKVLTDPTSNAKTLVRTDKSPPQQYGDIHLTENGWQYCPPYESSLVISAFTPNELRYIADVIDSIDK